MKKFKLFVATALVVSILGISSYAAVTTTSKGVQKLDSADIVDALNNNADVLDTHIDKPATTDKLGHVKVGTGLAVSDEGSTNVDTAYILNLIYPVGSVYMSVNDVSPQSFIGGEWERIEDRFLLGAGGKYDVNTTGGEETHTLTLDEIPNHSHTYTQFQDAIVGQNGTYFSSVWWDSGKQAETSAVGGGQGHNNMPPYLSVYMWKRVS